MCNILKIHDAKIAIGESLIIEDLYALDIDITSTKILENGEKFACNITIRCAIFNILRDQIRTILYLLDRFRRELSVQPYPPLRLTVLPHAVTFGVAPVAYAV